ncbi:MAG: nicotinate (nicotinamide) nucleotide adenylyltransferase [Bacteroidetes bacterium]|nr:nicotinate (nicotinamide) nucleotide adenylyltransferase [Bacteroidota bacterium]MBU1681031.1 nicotinate (nicotinamide) nucleotide adenylyltransferase [Bacteroidota bacterium]MBU2505533.1 nicotinate (nicotinamide) nucleotide adenylyltransferase [Bacteroidota bacterium]
MKPVGIFGGTFDPIHIGHLITAESVFEQRELEKIIFIPCFISPHKTNVKSIEAIHRIKMVELAAEGNQFIEVSDYEINKGDVSYTFDTLQYLKQQYENLELIIGYDNLVNFHTWKNPEGILELTKLLVLKRKSDDDEKKLHNFYDNTIYINTPVIEISSSEIRKRIAAGLKIRNLVPPKVDDYINENSLYSR